MTAKKPQVEKDFQPILTANYDKKGAQFIIFIEFWITTVLLIYINRPFYALIIDGNYWLLFIVPLALFGLFWQYAGITLVLSKIIYLILCKIEPPKEGVFSIPGREFDYYRLRFWVQYYAVYVMRAMPLPWADMFIYKFFGQKIGSNVVLYDSWIDMEFIEVQDSVMLSLNTAIYSHCIYEDKFLVKRVVIKKNAIVGAEAIVGPGTVVEEGAILGAACSTKIDQVLDAYRIHVGTPAFLSLPIKILDDDEAEARSCGKNQEENK